MEEKGNQKKTHHRLYRRAPKKEELKNAALVGFRNAEELLSDAELLHFSKRFARSIFLSCIGLEELGKATLSLELFEEKWEFFPRNKAKEFWDFWRDHLSKTAHGLGYLGFNPIVLEKIVGDKVPKGFKNWEEYEKKKRELYAEQSSLTSSIKISALYVDFVDKEKQGRVSGFTLPSAYFKEEHSKKGLDILRERIKDLEPRIRKLGWLNVPPYPPDEEGLY